jgi:hypothetical protein
MGAAKWIFGWKSKSFICSRRGEPCSSLAIRPNRGPCHPPSRPIFKGSEQSELETLILEKGKDQGRRCEYDHTLSLPLHCTELTLRSLGSHHRFTQEEVVWVKLLMSKLDAMKKYSSHTADLWKKACKKEHCANSAPTHNSKRERGSLPLLAQVQGHRSTNRACARNKPKHQRCRGPRPIA